MYPFTPRFTSPLPNQARPAKIQGILTCVYAKRTPPPNHKIRQVAKRIPQDTAAENPPTKRVAAPEKKAIEQRAAALGISASELVRRSAIYGKIESFNFDIAEVEKLHHELLKEGTNLNQLMYFVNAQGLPAYNEKAVFRTLEKVYQNARKVDRFIEELKKRYHVDYVPHDYLADEPDNRNL